MNPLFYVVPRDFAGAPLLFPTEAEALMAADQLSADNPGRDYVVLVAVTSHRVERPVVDRATAKMVRMADVTPEPAIAPVTELPIEVVK